MDLTLTDDVFVSLLESYENVQHFELSAPDEMFDPVDYKCNDFKLLTESQPACHSARVS